MKIAAAKVIILVVELVSNGSMPVTHLQGHAVDGRALHQLHNVGGGLVNFGRRRRSRKSAAWSIILLTAV